MGKHYFNLFICFLFMIADAVIFSSCYRYSGKVAESPAGLVDDSTIAIFSERQYAAFVRSNPSLTGTVGSEMVRRVCTRMTTAVTEYMSIVGRGGMIRQNKWECHLIYSDEPIAWCLPGGKIIIYNGLLPITQTEVGLAAVMAHEVAHAMTRHDYDRIAVVLQKEYGGASLAALLSGQPMATQSIFATTYGTTTHLSTLAYTRKQEYEADELGMYFMAMAGYDPHEAVLFWRRMAVYDNARTPAFLDPNEAPLFWNRTATHDKGRTPAFLVIHPSDQDRVNHMVGVLTKVMPYYRP